MVIPVRNLWLLLFYASDLFQQWPDSRRVALEENPDDLAELLAELLAYAVEKRLRRHLSLGYTSRAAHLSRVRGRILALETEARRLLERGMVACRFDELSIDTPGNRYVRAALETVASMIREDDPMASKCRGLARNLEAMGVSRLVDPRNARGVDRAGLRDFDDRLMISAARLVFDLALPTQEAGGTLMVDPRRREAWMHRLFEKAVGGFYKVVLRPRGWQVKGGSRLEWPAENPSDGIMDVLPTMNTDIELVSPERDRKIVIDTKFTGSTTQSQYRKTLKSGYLYQIYAYLRSQEKEADALSNTAEGLFIHPVTQAEGAMDEAVADEEITDEEVTIQGHRIRFINVNLSGTTAAIRSSLLAATEPSTNPTSPSGS